MQSNIYPRESRIQRYFCNQWRHVNGIIELLLSLCGKINIWTSRSSVVFSPESHQVPWLLTSSPLSAHLKQQKVRIPVQGQDKQQEFHHEGLLTLEYRKQKTEVFFQLQPSFISSIHLQRCWRMEKEERDHSGKTSKHCAIELSTESSGYQFLGTG